jgi:hypothetical protein
MGNIHVANESNTRTDDKRQQRRFQLCVFGDESTAVDDLLLQGCCGECFRSRSRRNENLYDDARAIDNPATDFGS